MWVHTDNPIASLTLAQLDAVLSVERRRGYFAARDISVVRLGHVAWAAGVDAVVVDNFAGGGWRRSTWFREATRAASSWRFRTWHFL